MQSDPDLKSRIRIQAKKPVPAKKNNRIHNTALHVIQNDPRKSKAIEKVFIHLFISTYLKLKPLSDESTFKVVSSQKAGPLQ